MVEDIETASRLRKEVIPKLALERNQKGSGRRLYTDEDPSDTVSVEFSSVAAIKRTLAKKVLRLNPINVNLKL